MLGRKSLRATPLCFNPLPLSFLASFLTLLMCCLTFLSILYLTLKVFLLVGLPLGLFEYFTIVSILYQQSIYKITFKDIFSPPLQICIYCVLPEELSKAIFRIKGFQGKIDRVPLLNFVLVSLFCPLRCRKFSELVVRTLLSFGDRLALRKIDCRVSVWPLAVLPALSFPPVLLLLVSCRLLKPWGFCP